MDCSMPGFPVLHYLLELLKLTSIKLVMPANHLIHCCLFLLLPSIFPSIRVFSSHFFTSGGQSIGVSASASVLPIHSLKKFISHSSFLLERPNYTSGIRATRPEHCGPTQSVEVCHHKEPLTFCTGFNPSQKACVTVPQILLCF